MTLSEIKTIVCKSFGIEECDFVITTRSNEFAFPRFAYYALCRKHTLLSFESIGKSVLRKHSTVSRGITRHEDLLALRKVYSDNFKKAEKELKDKTK